MEFFIKKNATLPLLKMAVVRDGRNDYNNMMDFIEQSSIFFSMVSVDTGIPKISTRPAGFVSVEQLDPNADPEYFVYYQFTPRDTNKVGRYQGQFLFRNDQGTMILPIREELYINVQESFIADDLEYASCYVVDFPCCIVDPIPAPTTTTTTTIDVVTDTPTPTPTLTPTVTPTTSVTVTPTITPTVTPTNTPTTTPTTTPTNTPGLSPTSTPTQTVTPTITPTVTPTNTVTPTETPTNTPTNTVTPTITPTNTPTPSITPTITPSPNPTILEVFASVQSPIVPFSGTAWYAVSQTNDPTQPYPIGLTWNQVGGPQLISQCNTSVSFGTVSTFSPNTVYFQIRDVNGTILYAITSGFVFFDPCTNTTPSGFTQSFYNGSAGNIQYKLKVIDPITTTGGPALTPTPTPTITPTETPTNTPTPTITPTNTVTPTETPTNTPTPTITPTPTPTSQVLIDPIITGNDEYISVGNDEYLMFVVN